MSQQAMACLKSIILLAVIIIAIFAEGITSSSVEGEEPCLMDLFSQFATASGSTQQHAYRTLYEKSDSTILVHIQLNDGVIKTNELLEEFGRVIESSEKAYLDFQFHHLENKFSTRLTPQKILKLSSQRHTLKINSIKRVSNKERQLFPQLTLESLRLGKVLLVMERGRSNEMSQWISWTNQMMQTTLSTMGSVNSETYQTVLSTLPNLLDWKTEENRVFIGLTNELDESLGFGNSNPKPIGDDKPDPIISLPIDELSTRIGKQLYDYLSSQESIDYITRSFRHEANNYGANQVVQSGGNDASLMWKRGLTGEGQVITIMDSGLDVNHCFFSSPNETYTDTVNLSNRKVVYYAVTPGGDTLDSSGHGTHVGGTLAGAPSVAQGNPRVDLNYGIARDAKLFFIDVDKASSFSIPSNFTSYLNMSFVRAGSRISSNSWGCSLPLTCSYDCNCRDGNNRLVLDSTCQSAFGVKCCEICGTYQREAYEFDGFLRTNDEAVAVMASGNIGYIARTGTVLSPSVSKNGISVGASYAPFSYYDQFNISRGVGYNMTDLAYFSSRGPTFGGRIKPGKFWGGDL